jgi:hypothetical protein
MAIVGCPQLGIPRSDRLAGSKEAAEGRPPCVDACSFCTLRSARKHGTRCLIRVQLKKCRETSRNRTEPFG